MASVNSNNIPDIETLAVAALHAAQGQLGQCENPRGSNSGPMVNEYLHAVGLPPGYAWCQAFVYWCYGTAAGKLKLSNPAVKTGSVHDCWSHSASAVGIAKLLKADVVQRPELVKPGDQFILLFGGNAGHTGIVERVESTTFHTIEGNSNNNGSREGYEVVRHQRSFSDKDLAGFIRYTAAGI